MFDSHRFTNLLNDKGFSNSFAWLIRSAGCRALGLVELSICVVVQLVGAFELFASTVNYLSGLFIGSLGRKLIDPISTQCLQDSHPKNQSWREDQNQRNPPHCSCNESDGLARQGLLIQTLCKEYGKCFGHILTSMAIKFYGLRCWLKNMTCSFMCASYLYFLTVHGHQVRWSTALLFIDILVFDVLPFILWTIGAFIIHKINL